MITRVCNPAYRWLKADKSHKVQWGLVSYFNYLPKFNISLHPAKLKTLVSIFKTQVTGLRQEWAIISYKPPMIFP